MTSDIVPQDWLREKAADPKTLDRYEERNRLAEIIAMLQDKKVYSIIGNENLFAILYDRCALSDTLERGVHATVYNDPFFQLLYLYHLQRLMQQRLIDGPSLAATRLRKEISDVPQRSNVLQDEDLQYFLSRLNCKRMDYFSNNDMDVCLDIIICAIFDVIVWDLKGDDKTPLTDGEHSQICDKFREIEGEFDLAFFFITAFANIPLPEEFPFPKNDPYVDARKTYSDLIQRCKDDVGQLQQSSVGNFSYAKLWNTITTRRNVEEESLASDLACNVLAVGFKLYNLRCSFVFYHNRRQLPCGHQGRGPDGLIATFLRLNALALCSIDLCIAIARRVQNVFSLFHEKSENFLLARFKQIFAAGSAIMQWNELIDALSGRQGEGAARLVCALDSALPRVDIDPSIFFELDTCISTEAQWSFLKFSDPVSYGFTIMGNPVKNFRLQAKLVFAQHVSPPVIVDDVSKPTTTMNLIYGRYNNKFVEVLQCIYYKGFAQPSQVFLQSQLDAILVNNAVTTSTVSELGKIYDEKTASFIGRFLTFKIDWNYLKSFSVDDMVDKMTPQFRQTLVKRMEKYLLDYNSALERETLQADEDAQQDYDRRVASTAVHYNDSMNVAARVATIYHDSTPKNLDGFLTFGSQQTSNVVISSQPSQSFQITQSLSQLPNTQQDTQHETQNDTQHDTQQDTQQDTQHDPQNDIQHDPDDDVDDKPKTKQIQKDALAKKKADCEDENLKRSQRLDEMRKLVENSNDNLDVQKRARKPSSRPQISKPDVPALTNRVGKRSRESRSMEKKPTKEPLPHDQGYFTYRIGYCKPNTTKIVMDGTFFTYYPLVGDVQVGENHEVQYSFKDIQEDREKSGFNCLYPFEDPRHVRDLQKDQENNHESEFVLNYWTIPYDDLPKVFRTFYKTKKEFDDRRQKFCKTWIKHIWSLNTEEFIVHLGNEEVENSSESEFTRLVLGAGFLIFKKSFLEEFLEKDKIDELMKHDVFYPWNSGEQVYAALNDEENFKSLLPKWRVDAKITTVTINDWALKQEAKLNKDNYVKVKKAKTIAVPLPQPKKGASLVNLRDEKRGRKPKMASTSTSDENNNADDDEDGEHKSNDYSDDDHEYGSSKKSKVLKAKTERVSGDEKVFKKSLKIKKDQEDQDWVLSIFSIALDKTEVKDKRGRTHYERLVRRHGRDKNNNNIRENIYSLDENDFQRLVTKHGENNKVFKNHLCLPLGFEIDNAIAITEAEVESALAT